MQKIFVTIFAAALMIMPAQAATWVAADRVAAVGNIQSCKWSGR